ncbi:hypothetical protein QJS10_CPA08g01635 [Acorus calamus]|uniref:Uncharacterized protein n=1 Tax=Acorus calamus TaxID=4465 RepID=A0AAV9EAP0_ACOCL|nr:hypothetical protein QJS10_CPA08g01635 [Acorus calamus]
MVEYHEFLFQGLGEAVKTMRRRGSIEAVWFMSTINFLQMGVKKKKEGICGF